MKQWKPTIGQRVICFGEMRGCLPRWLMTLLALPDRIIFFLYCFLFLIPSPPSFFSILTPFARLIIIPTMSSFRPSTMSPFAGSGSPQSILGEYLEKAGSVPNVARIEQHYENVRDMLGDWTEAMKVEWIAEGRSLREFAAWKKAQFERLKKNQRMLPPTKVHRILEEAHQKRMMEGRDTRHEGRFQLEDRPRRKMFAKETPNPVSQIHSISSLFALYEPILKITGRSDPFPIQVSERNHRPSHSRYSPGSNRKDPRPEDRYPDPVESKHHIHASKRPSRFKDTYAGDGDLRPYQNTRSSRFEDDIPASNKRGPQSYGIKRSTSRDGWYVSLPPDKHPLRIGHRSFSHYDDEYVKDERDFDLHEAKHFPPRRRGGISRNQAKYTASNKHPSRNQRGYSDDEFEIPPRRNTTHVPLGGGRRGPAPQNYRHARGRCSEDDYDDGDEEYIKVDPFDSPHCF